MTDYTRSIDKVLAKFPDAQQNGSATSWKALCPAHADDRASLSIGEGADGKALLYCHAGCTPQEVCRAVGLKIADLKPSRTGKRRIVSQYDYRDETGELLLQVRRYEPKEFKQFRPDGSGRLIAGGKGVRVVPYRLPQLLAARNVTVVEGEKDCDNLASFGLTATCNAGGAGKWTAEHSTFLRGKRVVILPDNDDAGRKHAEQVARSLSGIADEIRIVNLPDLPEKGDVSDWLEAGHDEIELLKITTAAPLWEPSDADAVAPVAPVGSLTDDDQRTDAANAKRLVAKHGDRMRWCDAWQKWLVWDGRRWAVDDTCRVESFAKEIGEEVMCLADGETEKPILSFARSSNSAAGVRNMLALARSEPGIPILPDQLDSDAWLLNLENGTLDLQTGKIRDHRRDDLITKLAPVSFNPAADCPTWMEFLKRILNADRAVELYLRKLVGYSLTGSTREHVLPFLHGGGANGKSTFITTILALLGTDYSMKAPSDLLLSKHNESHPTALADLFGKRFVACVEADSGRRLAESLVKEMTGGDRIRARRMREDFWEFQPTHKIWLAANHKPIIRGADHGMWRRVKLIPFTVKIPDDEQDKELPAKLLAELPGILNWAMNGCLKWQRDGLGEPAAVQAATADYRDEMDVIGEFIAEQCRQSDLAETGATALYREYVNWCEMNKTKPVSQTAFGAQLSERGIERKKTRHGIMRIGISFLGVNGLNGSP